MSELHHRKFTYLFAAYVVVMSGLVWWIFVPSRISELGASFGWFSERIAEGNLAPSSMRSPAVPYFLAAVASVGGQTLVAVLLKNILVQPLMLWSLYQTTFVTRARIASFAVVLFVLTCPRLIKVGYSVIPEEAWLIPLLAFVFYQLLFAKRDFRITQYALIGLVIAIVLLTKSSMRFLCPVLVLLFFVKSRDWRVVIVLGIFCAAAFLAWGAFNYAATGQVRFESSFDGYNLYKGNNPRTLEFYPDRDLDHLSPELADMVDWQNEWAAHDTYVRETMAFWRNQPGAAYQLFLLRAYKMFLAVTPEGMGTGGSAKLTMRMVSVVYFLVFRIVFLLCVGYAIWRLAWWIRQCLGQRHVTDDYKRVKVVGALTFIGFTLAYSAPFLVGFTYERHVLPLVVPTLLFGLWVLDHESDRIHRTLATFLPDTPGASHRDDLSTTNPASHHRLVLVAYLRAKVRPNDTRSRCLRHWC